MDWIRDNPVYSTKEGVPTMVVQTRTERFMGKILASDRIDECVDGQPRDTWVEQTLCDCLRELLNEKGLTRAQVIAASDVNETFGYQIFKGARRASRDKLLQLCFGMGATVREADRVLRAGDVGRLYARDRRDAVVIFCLNRGYSLMAVDEELYRRGMRTIKDVEG